MISSSPKDRFYVELQALGSRVQEKAVRLELEERYPGVRFKAIDAKGKVIGMRWQQKDQWFRVDEWCENHLLNLLDTITDRVQRVINLSEQERLVARLQGLLSHESTDTSTVNPQESAEVVAQLVNETKEPIQLTLRNGKNVLVEAYTQAEVNRLRSEGQIDLIEQIELLKHLPRR